MDFRQLKYFIAVAEEENIGRAARRLNISQPPLTRQIKQIEDELSVSLFTRTPKGMELTSVGKLFLDEARNIEILFEQATERTLQAAQGKLGRLDVAIFGSGILDAIPKILLAFTETHPDVKVHLHQMGKAEQIEALRQRRITVGFNRLLAPLPDITSELVLNEGLLLAINEKHPLSRLHSVPLTALADQPLILFPSSGRPNFIDKVVRICQENGFYPKVAQEVGDAVSGVALVAAGFGICIIPESLTSLALPGVVFRPFSERPPHWSVDLSCIYRANDDSPILAEFLQTVRAFRGALKSP
ncbi:MAG: LysR substrate-binding domain-containing protein [Zavarzinia sp.]|nr:LysR substrate-binding domain-containing protein [Zavarzinia sp.]